MNNNYIVIDPKRTNPLKKRLKLLESEDKINRKDPFVIKNKERYYYIDGSGNVNGYNYYTEDSFEESLIRPCNAFNDEIFTEQVALHQLLYRKLLKFAYNNGFEDNREWDGVNPHWCVRYICDTGVLFVDVDYDYKSQSIYFSSDEAAIRAIKEIVEPFMKNIPILYGERSTTNVFVLHAESYIYRFHNNCYLFCLHKGSAERYCTGVSFNCGRSKSLRFCLRNIEVQQA